MSAARAGSPCVDVCMYDYGRDFCTGCGRTLIEISSWSIYTSEKKQQITEKCKKRLDSLPDPCYNQDTTRREE